ncbi:hypothetical protein UlMin_040758 [Ulmus minor]
MVDVMSHGGDAGSDPPHPGSSHVPSQCESSQPRRRGDSKGLRLQQLFNANGRRPLRIHWDRVEGTLQPIGEFHELVTRFVSSHIKHNVGPHHETWESVDAHLKEQLLNAVERYFDLRYNHTEEQYHYVRLGIDRMAQDRYRDYKYKVHQHFKLKGADEPYKQMSEEVWKKCVERFTSRKFLERSKKNESNRSKAKYPSSQGTKSFSALRYDMRNRETEEWPTLVSSWKTFHTNKKGEWVNATAAQDYEELQTQTQEAMSSGTEVDERAVTRRVLGERRGHEKGVGRILKGLGSSPSSTTRSRTSYGAGFSSSGPSQEEFAAMQAQFAAMQAQSEQYRSFAAMQQQFMTNLLGQLQTTVPNFHLDVPFPVFPNLNEPLNPTPNPYLAGNDNQQEEADDDENLGDD